MSGILTMFGSAAAGAVVAGAAVKIAKKLARMDEWQAGASSSQIAITPARVVGRASRYRLAKQFSFGGKCGQKGGIIPAGFEFDGASIPSLFWSLVGSPFSANLLRAALIHDFRYREIFVSNSNLTRAEKRAAVKIADAEFYENLREAGNRKVLAAVMFAAVRVYSTLKGIK